jgi:hypothetical protein
LPERIDNATRVFLFRFGEQRLQYGQIKVCRSATRRNVWLRGHRGTQRIDFIVCRKANQLVCTRISGAAGQGVNNSAATLGDDPCYRGREQCHARANRCACTGFFGRHGSARNRTRHCAARNASSDSGSSRRRSRQACLDAAGFKRRS